MQANTTPSTGAIPSDLQVAALEVLDLLAPWTFATTDTAPDPVSTETIVKVSAGSRDEATATLYVLRDHHGKPFYVVTGAGLADLTHTTPHDAADDLHQRTGTTRIS